jgi:hypothetical protein
MEIFLPQMTFIQERKDNHCWGMVMLQLNTTSSTQPLSNNDYPSFSDESFQTKSTIVTGFEPKTSS